MTRIVTVHSFRRGVGKSTLAANLAALLTQRGRRVGLVDADFQAPSLHILTGLPENEISATLNDYLQGRSDAPYPATHDLTARLGINAPGYLCLTPASTRVAEIMHMLRNACDFDRFHEGLQAMAEAHQLDMLVIDSMAGLNEDTLQTIAMAHTLIEILRPEQQDYQGTAVTVEVARTLQVPRTLLVLNDAPPTLDIQSAWAELAQTYHCEVGAILPYSYLLTSLASSAIFVLRFPDEVFTQKLRTLAQQVDA